MTTYTYSESISASAVPRPQLISPFYTSVSAVTVFNIGGGGFINISNVYLSGAPVLNQSTVYNTFSASNYGSAFPAITAYQLPTNMYTVNSDNTLMVTASVVKVGYFDIIVENEAGYGTLIQYSQRSGSFQHEWVKGVVVNGS